MRKYYCIFDCIYGGLGYCEISGAPLDERDTIDDGGDCSPCRGFKVVSYDRP